MEVCQVAFGRRYIVEDTADHKVVLVDAHAATPAQRENRIDLGKHLSGAMMKDWSPSEMAMIGDSFRRAAQMAPDLVSEARNEVRRNKNLTPIVEVAFAKEPRDVIEGRVTGQNDTQTILTRARKGHAGESGRVEEMIVFDNDSFIKPPKPNETVRIQRDAPTGLFKADPLSNAKKGGLSQ